MSKDISSTTPITVSLDLGELELPLDELLALREGSTLTVDVPEVLTGKIRVQGYGYALVSIVSEAGKLKLEVQELLSLPAVK